MPVENLYETDFFAWTQHQAGLLKDKRFDEVDTDHIAEEIEDMGISQKQQLMSRLGVLVAHLIKWKYRLSFSVKVSGLWKGTIVEQRRKIKRLLKDSPSFKRLLNEDNLNEIYGDALAIVLKDTGKEPSNFSIECPFNFEQIMDSDFWPESNKNS
jgi:hypothetical protein